MSIDSRVLWTAIVFVAIGCAEGAPSDEPEVAAPIESSADASAPVVPAAAAPATNLDEPPAAIAAATDLAQPPADGSTCVPPGDRPLPELPVEEIPDSLQDQMTRIVELEQELSSADSIEAPRILMTLGRIKSSLRPYGSAEAVEFVGGRAEFYRDESSGDYIYRGNEFRAIGERYPGSELADDASYALTLLTLGGECEGYVGCYLSRDWSRLARFLSVHGGSPLAPVAIDRALEAFDRIGPDRDLLVRDEYYDPTDVQRQVELLDRTGLDVPPPQGNRLLERAAELWLRFEERDRARVALENAIMRTAAPAVRACLEAKMEALSAEPGRP